MAVIMLKEKMVKGKSVGVRQCRSVSILCVCLCLCAYTFQMSPYRHNIQRIMLLSLVFSSDINAFVRNQYVSGVLR